MALIGQETAPDRRRVSSAELCGSQNRLVIAHQGEAYRLRNTCNGKLMLTK